MSAICTARDSASRGVVAVSRIIADQTSPLVIVLRKTTGSRFAPTVNRMSLATPTRAGVGGGPPIGWSRTSGLGSTSWRRATAR